MLDILIFILIVVSLAGLLYGLFGIDVIADTTSQYEGRFAQHASGKSGSVIDRKYLGNLLGNTKGSKRKQNIEDALKKIEKNQSRKDLSSRLQSSGLNLDPMRFIALSIALGIFIFLISGKFLDNVVIKLSISVISGFLIPNKLLDMHIKSYHKKFIDNFTPALEIIIRGVKSGLPLSDCLKIIATEAPSPIKEEFYILTEEQRIGITLEQALKRLYRRLPLAEVNFFCIVLTINAKMGGNITEPMQGLVNVLKGRKKLLDKIKGASSEAKGSAYVLGSLPFLISGGIYAMNPSYLSILWTDPKGIVIVCGAVFWMGIGVFVMSNMINFKY